MGGQHGIGSKNTDSEIPPFLPVQVHHHYSGTCEKLYLIYAVNLNPHSPDKADFTIKANGVPQFIAEAFMSGPKEITIWGGEIDFWTHPVTVSYDGSNPDFKSISNAPAEQFTDLPAP